MQQQEFKRQLIEWRGLLLRCLAFWLVLFTGYGKKPIVMLNRLYPQLLAGGITLLITLLPLQAFSFEKSKLQKFESLPASVAMQGEVQALFAPRHDIEGVLVKLIHDAQHTVQLAAYGFTSRSLAQALIQAKKRGVRVEVLLDYERTVKERAADRMKIIPELLAEGVMVRVWRAPAHTDGIMHHKFIVIDSASKNATVITGSYNFTFSARSRNAENVLILRNAQEASKSFTQEFNQLYMHAIALK